MTIETRYGYADETVHCATHLGSHHLTKAVCHAFDFIFVLFDVKTLKNRTNCEHYLVQYK